MVDENEVILQTTYIRTVFRLGSVDKVRICEIADKGGDLWSHAMLDFQPGVGIPLQHQPLEETSVKIEPIAPLHRKAVVVDLWTELSVNMVSTIMKAHNESIVRTDDPQLK